MDKALIQFSCAEKETTSENVFTESLLKNIRRKNTPIIDLFQVIAKDIHRKRYELFSAQGLSQYGHIFLDQIISRTYKK